MEIQRSRAVTVPFWEKLTFILSFLWFYHQGPLEKSLQNSVAFERQKNLDNRVGIIRGSVQVSETHLRWVKTFLELSRTSLNMSASS